MWTNLDPITNFGSIRRLWVLLSTMQFRPRRDLLPWRQSLAGGTLWLGGYFCLENFCLGARSLEPVTLDRNLTQEFKSHRSHTAQAPSCPECWCGWGCECVEVNRRLQISRCGTANLGMWVRGPRTDVDLRFTTSAQTEHRPTTRLNPPLCAWCSRKATVLRTAVGME